MFPLFNVGSELPWDTTGSASSFELIDRCQELQALAVGQRGPPSLARLGSQVPRVDSTGHSFQELSGKVPTSGGQMATYLLRVPPQL